LLPIGILFSLAGLLFTYWVDKYMLLRRHSRPNALGKELAEQMSDFLELFLVSFSTGNVIWESLARPNFYISTLNWITLIIAVVIYVLPNGMLASCILKNEEETFNTKNYDDVRLFFTSDYDRANPITAEDAMRSWFMEVSNLSGDAQATDHDASKPTEQGEKKNFNDFFKHLPKQNALSNYANSNPTFQQMQHMPQRPMMPTNNTMINNHLPKPIAQMMPQFNNFASNMQQFRPFGGPQVNPFQQMFGNRFGGVMPTPQNPQFASHMPQTQTLLFLSSLKSLPTSLNKTQQWLHLTPTISLNPTISLHRTTQPVICLWEDLLQLWLINSHSTHSLRLCNLR
jgi:hypothetical protein